MINNETVMQIGDKLSIPTSEVYHIFVEAQYTLGLIYIIGFFLVIGMPFVVYLGIRNKSAQPEDTFAISVMVGVISGLVMYVIIYKILTALLIPEYVVIQQMI